MHKEVIIMKLSDYAKRNFISYQSAWNQYKVGLIPNARQLPTGMIVVDEDKPTTCYTIIYTRVGSTENKSNLDSQASRLVDFCVAKRVTS